MLSSTSTPITASGTEANNILGQTTANNALVATRTDAQVAAAVTAGTLAGGQFTINGISVTGTGITSDATLAAAINANTQLQALGITATDTANTSFTISANSPIAITVGGTVGTALTPAASTTQTITGGAADAALANAAGTFTTPLALAAGQLTVNGTSVTGTYTTLALLNTAIQTASGNANLSASISGGNVLSLATSNGSAFTVGGTQTSTLLGETLATQAASSYSVNQSGSLAGIDVLSVSDAQHAIQAVDAALNQVNTMQGELGAVQNRFSSTISNLSSLTQNAQSAPVVDSRHELRQRDVSAVASPSSVASRPGDGCASEPAAAAGPEAVAVTPGKQVSRRPARMRRPVLEAALQESRLQNRRITGGRWRPQLSTATFDPRLAMRRSRRHRLSMSTTISPTSSTATSGTTSVKTSTGSSSGSSSSTPSASSIISSVGLGLGTTLPISQVLTGLMQVESIPLTQLQNQVGGVQTEISAYGQLTSALSTFQQALTKLNQPTEFQTFSATSSNTSALTASAVVGAQAGTYTVATTQLAQAQSLATAGQAA